MGVHVVGCGELEGEEGQNDLHRVGAAVHEVAVEQVHVGSTGRAVDVQHVQQVKELAVQIPAHLGHTQKAGGREGEKDEATRGSGRLLHQNAWSTYLQRIYMYVCIYDKGLSKECEAHVTSGTMKLSSVVGPALPPALYLCI